MPPFVMPRVDKRRRTDNGAWRCRYEDKYYAVFLTFPSKRKGTSSSSASQLERLTVRPPTQTRPRAAAPLRRACNLVGAARAQAVVRCAGAA
jgi:hypothetical protein